MNRIKSLDWDATKVVMVLSEGNPGAVVVISEILSKGSQIDKDSLHPMLILLRLDALGIYGSRLWMLYKDVCGMDIVNTIAVIRSHQLGIIDDFQLNHAIDNFGDGLNVEHIYKKVTEQLPNFYK